MKGTRQIGIEFFTSILFYSDFIASPTTFQNSDEVIHKIFKVSLFSLFTSEVSQVTAAAALYPNEKERERERSLVHSSTSPT